MGLVASGEGVDEEIAEGIETEGGVNSGAEAWAIGTDVVLKDDEFLRLLHTLPHGLVPELGGKVVPSAEAGERVLAWIQGPLADLQHGRVDALVAAALRALPAPSLEAAHLVETTAAYYLERRDQMQSPAFWARGLQIGSSLVESGCKRVITQRLCGSGMQWTVSGAQAIAALRAAYLSGRWSEVQALAGVACPSEVPYMPWR